MHYISHPIFINGAHAPGICILGKKPSKFLRNQEAAAVKLCGMFGAEVLRETSFHDGMSPIILTVVSGFKDNFKELWNFLVPPAGRAQTARER